MKKFFKTALASALFLTTSFSAAFASGPHITPDCAPVDEPLSLAIMVVAVGALGLYRRAKKA